MPNFQIYIEGIEEKTFVLYIFKDVSVKDVRIVLAEKTLVPAHFIRLFYRSRELNDQNEHGDNLPLSDYDLEDRSTLVVVIRVNDSYINNSGNWDLTHHCFEDDCLSRAPKKYTIDSEVVLTLLPDVITLDDGDSSNRALLSCQHAIGPDSMTTYCKSILESGKYEFICPVPDCGHHIEFEEARKVAALTEKELWEFETKLATNFIFATNDVQKCSRCGSYCDRNESALAVVECSICWAKGKVKNRFCWFCRGLWVNPGSDECGNKNCSTENPKKKILRESKEKVISGKICPVIRLCPRCKILIEHTEGCPQMECRCKQKFCFICLQQADSSGRYVCGSESCTKAPIQTEV